MITFCFKFYKMTDPPLRGVEAAAGVGAGGVGAYRTYNSLPDTKTVERVSNSATLVSPERT